MKKREFPKAGAVAGALAARRVAHAAQLPARLVGGYTSIFDLQQKDEREVEAVGMRM